MIEIITIIYIYVCLCLCLSLCLTPPLCRKLLVLSCDKARHPRIISLGARSIHSITIYSHTPSPFPNPPPKTHKKQNACDGCVRAALQEKGFQGPLPPGVCSRGGHGHPVGLEELHPIGQVRNQVRNETCGCMCMYYFTHACTHAHFDVVCVDVDIDMHAQS